jgi:hypothetical protein
VNWSHLGAGTGQVLAEGQAGAGLDAVAGNVAARPEGAQPVAVVELRGAVGVGGDVQAAGVGFAARPGAQPAAAAGRVLVDVSAAQVVDEVARLPIHRGPHPMPLGIINVTGGRGGTLSHGAVHLDDAVLGIVEVAVADAGAVPLFTGL